MPLKDELRHLWAPLDYRPNFGSAAVVSPPPPAFLRVYYLTSAEHAVSDIALDRIKVARFADLNDTFELLGINFRESHVRTFCREANEIENSRTGLICFSSDWTSPVLWSHYASKRHGVCLGFDLRRTLAERVNYETERILAQISEDGDPRSLNPELQRLLRCTKYQEWNYEQEIRTFVKIEGMVPEGGL
jgi:hypothetical protein